MSSRVPWIELGALLAVGLLLYGWPNHAIDPTLRGVSIVLVVAFATIAHLASGTRYDGNEDSALLSIARALGVFAPVLFAMLGLGAPDVEAEINNLFAALVSVCVAGLFLSIARVGVFRTAWLTPVFSAVGGGAVGALVLVVVARSIVPRAFSAVAIIPWLLATWRLRGISDPFDEARLRWIRLGSGVQLVAWATLYGLWPWDTALARVLAGTGALAAALGTLLAGAGIWLRWAGQAERVWMHLCVLGVVGGIVTQAVGAHAGVAVGLVVSAVSLWGLRWIDRVAWAEINRWEQAIGTSRAQTLKADSLDALAVRVLEPMRDAADDLRTHAALWVLEEESRRVLDVAGGTQLLPLVGNTERAILSWLRTNVGQVLVLDSLRARITLRPELQPVLNRLLETGARWVVPGWIEDELVCAIVLGTGSRKSPLRYEELLLLQELSSVVATSVSTLRALERARGRAEQARRDATQAIEEKSAAVAERDRAQLRARTIANSIQCGALEYDFVAYSPAMRRVDTKLTELSTHAEPALLLCPTGTEVTAMAHAIHARSSRASAPFLTVDAASVHPREVLDLLLGRAPSEASPGGSAGWIEIADDGTLFLLEAHALGGECLRRLDEAIQSGSVQVGASDQRVALRARIILASSLAPHEMGLPARLQERLQPSTIAIPSLADRLEDLEPMVMLAIDRSCRIHAREPLGISSEALHLLRSYDWPGNHAELLSVMEKAVARAGSRIERDAFAGLIRPSRDAASRMSEGERDLGATLLEGGDYDMLERRILENALERAAGNKSLAARSLGLARTTFIDKLRKHGMH